MTSSLWKMIRLRNPLSGFQLRLTMSGNGRLNYGLIEYRLVPRSLTLLLEAQEVWRA